MLVQRKTQSPHRPNHNTNFISYQQNRFCEEWLIDGNATQAAKRANYKPDNAGQQGHHLLKHPKILRRIEELRHQAALNAAVTPESIIAGVKALTDTVATLGDNFNPQAAYRGYELQARLINILGAEKNSAGGHTIINVVTGLEQLRTNLEKEVNKQQVSITHHSAEPSKG